MPRQPHYRGVSSPSPLTASLAGTRKQAPAAPGSACHSEAEGLVETVAGTHLELRLGVAGLREGPVKRVELEILDVGDFAS